MTELKVFIGHGFDSKLYDGGIESFRLQIQEALNEVEVICKKQGIDVKLSPFFLSDDFGRRLPGIVRDALDTSSIGIFDLTGLIPNVLYEMGYLSALERPVIPLLKKEGELPSDIKDVLAGFYSKETEIPELIISRLVKDVIETRGKNIGYFPNQDTLWFPYKPTVIAIICSPESERSRFASRKEANYIFIDNLEDRDALFEIATYLSRAFPNCRIERHSSETIIQEALHGDLVVIGGPGDSELLGNHVSRDVLKLLNIDIAWSDECDRVFFHSKEFIPVFNDKGQLIRDYGYFLRERNPYNSDRSLLLMSGVYTSGTLGAALAFSDHPQGKKNADIVRNILDVRAGQVGCFEALFPVEVSIGGSVPCPIISEEHIFPR